MKELTTEAKKERIPEVTDFINEVLETLDCPLKTQMQIDVAVDELFGNIAQYAYRPGSGDVTVRIETETNPAAVAITFIDSGIPYNPLLAEEPDITLSAVKRKIGGLGIFLVKKTMDAMDYEYRDGKNILRIRKNL